MNVVKSMYDFPVMVKEYMWVEKPYSLCGPTVMLTLYGPADGIREFQREVGYSCRYLN